MHDPILPLIQSEPLWQSAICHPLVVSPETIAIEAIGYWSSYTHDRTNPSQLTQLPLQARGVKAAAMLTSCIAIVEDGQLLGLLTAPDVVRLSAERYNLENVAIRAVMRSNLVTLRTSAFTELSVAVNLLEQHQICHLPIVDDRNYLLGLVTSESLQRHLVEDLTAKIDRQSAQLQGRESQLQAVVKRANDSIVVQSELEIRWRAEEAIAHQLRQQQTLGAIAQQIRNSLKLEEILATATDRVKELMMVDRVTIFQIFPNSGAIPTEERKIRAVDEVVAPEYPSLMGRNWENERISQEEFEFYLQGSPHIVVDMTQDRGSPRLREYLQKIGVKSKIVAPILLPSGTTETCHQPNNTRQIQLWGLVSVHMCSSQRDWQDAEAQLLQQIADQLAIAIQQASLFEQVQAELVERQQAEIQLRQSNQELARATRLKDEFLANMSHELRTPLNAILGMSEALQESAFGAINDRQLFSISSIEKSGKHLLSLINDILDLSKIEANKFDLELSDVSIQSLCQNSLLFIKELAHKRQIQLTTQLPEDLKQLKIRVDDRRCRQVLINLLSNAVKFTPEGGSVILDVRVVDGGVGSVGGVGGLGRGEDVSLVKQMAYPELIDRSDLTPPLRRIAFSIIDTGIGISPENIDKLFQSFVQIDSSLNRQYAGTGLGLALVKRIVELHGGTVSVESTIDRGSCFTVSLPFEPCTKIVVSPSLPLLAEPLPTVDRSTTMVEKALILVVEDNQANMETMTGYLKIRGYRSIEAGNGQQAIDLARLHRPDIILMDIQMPGMDGFEASRQIRQIPECAAIPIVALTALAMPSDRQKCLDAGANQYVSKPVKLGQLISTIESLLQGD